MRQALELALEALQFALHIGFPESSESQIKKGEKAYQQHRAAITAIKEALAQPEQEPVAWWIPKAEQFCLPSSDGTRPFAKAWEPLYTTPPQRKWVGLTDEEIADCAEKMEASDPTDSFWREFFRGIEAKLKEKNT